MDRGRFGEHRVEAVGLMVERRDRILRDYLTIIYLYHLSHLQGRLSYIFKSSSARQHAFASTYFHISYSTAHVNLNVCLIGTSLL